MGVDTRNATGRLMLTMLGGIAEFEREVMLERQREGIAKAKAAGKYKGRKRTAREESEKVHALKTQGVRPDGHSQAARDWAGVRVPYPAGGVVC